MAFPCAKSGGEFHWHATSVAMRHDSMMTMPHCNGASRLALSLMHKSPVPALAAANASTALSMHHIKLI